MSEQQQNTQALAKSTIATIGKFIADRKDSIQALLPRHVDPERMVKLAQAAISRIPKLAECTPLSILDCVLKSSQLGLELNSPTREAWAIPFYNSKTQRMEATFIPGYPGMIKLAYSSGFVSSIDAHCIFEDDFFEYEYGDKPFLKHRPSMKRGNQVGAYAICKMRSGEPIFEVLTLADIEDHKSRSRSANSGPWQTDYEEMSRKTAIRVLLKRVPASPEVQTAISYDEAADRGENSDPVIDVDALQIQSATETKTQELKAKLTAAQEKREPAPPVEEEPPMPEPPPFDVPPASDMPPWPQPPIAAVSVPPESPVMAQAKENLGKIAEQRKRRAAKEEPPKAAEPVATAQGPEPPAPTAAVNGNALLTEADRVRIVDALKVRPGTIMEKQTASKVEFAKYGYGNSKEIRYKDFDALYQWAQTYQAAG